MLDLPQRLRRFAERLLGDRLTQLHADLTVSFIGSGARRGLGLVTFVLMTRTLDKDDYALYYLGYLCFEIALYVFDFGLNSGLTRHVAKGIRTGQDQETAAMLRAVYLIKVGVGLTVACLGYVLAPFIATRLLDTPAAVLHLRIGFAAVLGWMLHQFYEAYFRTRLEFARHSLFILIEPAVILTGALALWFAGRLTSVTAQAIYAVGPLVAAIAAALWLPHGFLRARGSAWAALLRVWRFSRWVYISEVLGTVRFRLNGILLANFATIAEVGLYAYADKLASVLSLFSSTLITVYEPRASHLLTRTEIRTMLRTTYRGFLALLPLMLLLPLLSRPLIRLLAPEYVGAAATFSVLFVSILFSIAALPASSVLYSIGRPHVETAVQAIAIVITSVGGFLLIQRYGAVGAAMAMLVQRLVSALLVFGYVYRTVYRSRLVDGQDEEEDIYH